MAARKSLMPRKEKMTLSESASQAAAAPCACAWLLARQSWLLRMLQRLTARLLAWMRHLQLLMQRQHSAAVRRQLRLHARVSGRL